jgi:hypothetical protein
VKGAFKTNILEDDGVEIETIVTKNGAVTFSSVSVVLKPFEVVTLRLELE